MRAVGVVVFFHTCVERAYCSLCSAINTSPVQSYALYMKAQKTYVADDVYVALHGAASPIRDYQPCLGYRIPTCTPRYRVQLLQVGK